MKKCSPCYCFFCCFANAGSADAFVLRTHNACYQFCCKRFRWRSQGNENYGVYNGFADNFTTNNLTKGPVYYVAVFEFNQFSTGPTYLTSAYAQGQINSIILPVKLTALAVWRKNRSTFCNAQRRRK